LGLGQFIEDIVVPIDLQDKLCIEIFPIVYIVDVIAVDKGEGLWKGNKLIV